MKVVWFVMLKFGTDWIMSEDLPGWYPSRESARQAIKAHNVDVVYRAVKFIGNPEAK